MTQQEADSLVHDLVRTPAIAGWPYTKAEILRAYFAMARCAVDLLGSRIGSRELRNAASKIDVETAVAAWSREERAVAP